MLGPPLVSRFRGGARRWRLTAQDRHQHAIYVILTSNREQIASALLHERARDLAHCRQVGEGVEPALSAMSFAARMNPPQAAASAPPTLIRLTPRSSSSRLVKPGQPARTLTGSLPATRTTSAHFLPHPDQRHGPNANSPLLRVGRRQHDLSSRC